MDDLIKALGKATVFTASDANSGYRQVKIDDKDNG